MRLVDRYLLRELLIPLGYCLFGFLIFWISFDLFAEMHAFQEKGSPAGEIVWYYVIKTPELLTVVMPIALLLALLYALTNHSRHNELVALRGAGVSLGRISLPYLGVGVVFSLALFALNELWVPKTVEASREILHRSESSQSALGPGRWQSSLSFHNARAGRFWYIGAFNLDTYEMKSPHVSWQLPDMSNRSLIATNALRTNGCWVFYDVQEFVYLSGGKFEDNPSPTRTNILAVPEFAETPEQIKSEIKINRLKSIKTAKEAQLSISEIFDYLKLHPELSRDSYALLHTQLHSRLAWPWTCLVVVLIALPFGAASGRRSAFVGVASSIFICFTFFVLLRLSLALGTSGLIPPWLAAWFPNVLFSAVGIAMTARAR
ncbi:MAG: YjgP/YjgQ family permease [Pedosphaera sp.]|nr:YjgP/YjgQ family permease [Pedosphaera sp.]